MHPALGSLLARVVPHGRNARVLLWHASPHTMLGERRGLGGREFPSPKQTANGVNSL